MNNIHSKEQLRLLDFQYILEVYKKQNISLAAEALGTTQSAISYAIKRVEAAYGLTLFERRNHGVKPLPCTGPFIKEAESILHSSERLSFLGMDYLSQSIRTLRIGVCRLYERYYTTPLLNALARSFPGLNVSISSGHFQELYSALLDKKIDVIFTPITHSISGLMTIPLFTDRLLFIAPPGIKQPAVLPRRSSQLYLLCAKLLKNYFPDSLEMIEADSFYTVASYIKAQIGGGFIPASIMPKLELGPQIQILEFPEKSCTYPVGAFVQRRDTSAASIIRQLNITDAG